MRVAVCFEAHAHDAVEHEGEEADECVCADAIREPMEYRGDFEVALEHTKAALDVGEIFVPADDLLGAEVGDFLSKGLL